MWKFLPSLGILTDQRKKDFNTYTCKRPETPSEGPVFFLTISSFPPFSKSERRDWNSISIRQSHRRSTVLSWDR